MRSEQVSCCFQCHSRSSHIPLVLHPSMRSAWFRQIGTTEADKSDSVRKAEALLEHIAMTYHHDTPNTAQDAVPKSNNAVPSSNDDNWLAEICMTHVPDAPAAEKSEDEVQEEIKHYLKFEGGRGELQAPLVWWKVTLWNQKKVKFTRIYP